MTPPAVRRRRNEGITTCFSTNGGVVTFLLSDYPALLRAWVEGEVFFSGTGFHGESQTVRLADLYFIEAIPARAMAANRAEDFADVAEDRQQRREVDMLFGDDPSE